MQCWDSSDDDVDVVAMNDGSSISVEYIWMRNLVLFLVEDIERRARQQQSSFERRKDEAPEAWLDRLEGLLEECGKLNAVSKQDLCKVAKDFMQDGTWEKALAKRFGVVLKTLKRMHGFVPKVFVQKPELKVKHLMNNTLVRNYIRVLKFTTGGSHYLVLTEGGKVFGEGRNSFGQLGSVASEGKYYRGVVWEKGAIDIACGYSTSFVVAEDGTGYAAGNNVNGRLGIGEIPLDNNHVNHYCWRKMMAPPMKRIEAGSIYGMGLGRDNSVYTWGGYHFTGHANMESRLHRQAMRPSPYDLPFPKRVPIGKALTISIGPGGYHSVVLTAAGKVVVWGHNRVGQLGLLNDAVTHVVRPIPRTLDFPRFSVVYAKAGWGNTLLVTSKGECLICGRNCSGQLGIAQDNSLTAANGTPFHHRFQQLLATTEAVQDIRVSEQSVFVVYEDHVDIVGQAQRVLLSMNRGGKDLHQFKSSTKRFIWKMNNHLEGAYCFFLE